MKSIIPFSSMSDNGTPISAPVENHSVRPGIEIAKPKETVRVRIHRVLKPGPARAVVINIGDILIIVETFWIEINAVGRVSTTRET
jgi:hypothetical protein